MRPLFKHPDVARKGAAAKTLLLLATDMSQLTDVFESLRGRTDECPLFPKLNHGLLTELHTIRVYLTSLNRSKYVIFLLETSLSSHTASIMRMTRPYTCMSVCVHDFESLL